MPWIPATDETPKSATNADLPILSRLVYDAEYGVFRLIPETDEDDA